jgi:hypothetical protein
MYIVFTHAFMIMSSFRNKKKKQLAGQHKYQKERTVLARVDRHNRGLESEVPSVSRTLGAGLACRELDDSLLHVDYFHHVTYFWLNAARLCFIGCVRHMTCFHIGSAASDNKAKCSSSSSRDHLRHPSTASTTFGLLDSSSSDSSYKVIIGFL